MQHLQLQRTPQALPRARQIAINETPPQSAETRLDTLTHRTDQSTAQQGTEALNLPVSLATYGQQAKDYAKQAKAHNTRRAYAADWDDFARWCQPYGFVPLPAKPETSPYTSPHSPTPSSLPHSDAVSPPSPRSIRRLDMTRPRLPPPSAWSGPVSAVPKEQGSRAKPRPSPLRSAAWVPSRDTWRNELIHIEFLRSDCKACAVQSLCIHSKSGAREMGLQYLALQEARERQQTPGSRNTIAVGQAKTHVQRRGYHRVAERVTDGGLADGTPAGKDPPVEI